ncbi:MAG: S41 family peptidase [Bacteroides sp.]|jgi:carboxyl-terminal processing protease|nr:S41 family peptidase [Bacteroides sp.]
MKFHFVFRRSLLILTAFLVLFVQSSFGQVDNLQFEKMARVLQVVKLAYVEPVDEEKIVEDAIKGLLKELDPHSVYLSAEELKEANEPLQGSFEGIGVQFNIINDTIVVVSPVPGGPSEKVGIMPGDKIVSIDGEKSTGSEVNNQYVMDRLRGERGSKVSVGIFRRSSRDILDFVITRDRIPINSVDASFMAAPGIGYIKLNRFSRTTMREFYEAMSGLSKQGMEHLILDLNYNSGGYLDVAIDLSDQFLEDNKMIVYTEGHAAPVQERFSTSRGAFKKGKLVVLINEGSASASEILAGAIQDWDRGLIVGRRSFGKGLVQQPFNLPDGSAIRLTTARYHTPTGRSIQKPYDEGNDKYFEDLTQRLRMGELVSPENITFPDSLKYFTKVNKREVYGGGGIMPDVFIPLDTTRASEFYSRLVRQGVINSFGIEYANDNRVQLQASYPDVNTFIQNFKVDDRLLNDLYAYAEKQDITPGEEDLAETLPYLKIQLKGLVARNLFDFSAYIQVATEMDDAFQKAVHLIQSDTFDEMKIQYR